jgi:hypothetical protein
MGLWAVPTLHFQFMAASALGKSSLQAQGFNMGEITEQYERIGASLCLSRGKGNFL